MHVSPGQEAGGGTSLPVPDSKVRALESRWNLLTDVRDSAPLEP